MKYVLVEKSVISFISCLCLICKKFAGNASVFNSRFLIVYVGGFVVSEKTTTSGPGASVISNLRGWGNDFG